MEKIFVKFRLSNGENVEIDVAYITGVERTNGKEVSIIHVVGSSGSYMVNLSQAKILSKIATALEPPV